MSKKRHDSGWNQFGGGSGALLSDDPVDTVFSLDLVYGPTSASELISWAELDWFDSCPDPLHFKFKRVIDLIRERLAEGRGKHADLPPVFFGTLGEALNSIDSVVAGTPLPFFSCPMYNDIADWQVREGAREAGQQLLILFNEWENRHGESLSGTGDSVWSDVLAGPLAIGENLERIVWRGPDELPWPFYKWEVIYNPDSDDQLARRSAVDIAAWFSQFAAHQMLHKVAVLVADLDSGQLGAESREGYSNHLWCWWLDIERTTRLADYWFDKAWSIAETLCENEKVLRLISRAFKWNDSNPRPNVEYKSIGTCQLFDWFSNSADFKMTEVKLWQATWAALKDEQPPPDREKLENFYLDKHALAEKRIKSEGGKEEKNLLPVLARKVKNPTKTAVEGVVMRLTNREPKSGSTVIRRDMKKREKLIAEREEFSQQAKRRFLERRLLAEKAARKI